MNSARPQSSRQRIRDTGKTSGGDAVVLIAVAVESISIDESTSGDKQDDDGLAYVRAICDFRRLVLADHDRVLTDVVRSLTDAYGCRSVRTVTGKSRGQRSAAASVDLDGFDDCDDRPPDNGDDEDAGSILLELRQPRDRMISLQVDLSSGHLGRELQRRLATKNLTERLGLSELTLTTEIRSID